MTFQRALAFAGVTAFVIVCLLLFAQIRANQLLLAQLEQTQERLQQAKRELASVQDLKGQIAIAQQQTFRVKEATCRNARSTC